MTYQGVLWGEASFYLNQENFRFEKQIDNGKMLTKSGKYEFLDEYKSDSSDSKTNKLGRILRV